MFCKESKTPLLVYVLTVVSASGGFLFGYYTGVVSGAMLPIREHFHLDTVWHQLIVTATVFAALPFSLLSGYLSDQFGRRTTISMSSVVFVIGSVVMATAANKVVLLIGRIIVGSGVGIVSMSVPVYIAECAPSSIRGQLVLQNQIFITAGQFVAALVCGSFSRVQNGWRFMLGLGGLVALVQFFALFAMPESPRWLVAQQRHKDALTVLRSIRNETDNVESELNDIECSHKGSVNNNTGDENMLVRIFKTPHTRRALILGCLLQLFQQLSGINTVMYYSASIIRMSGIGDTSTAIWLAAITAGINFLCSFIGLHLVERAGRRTLTLYSIAGVILSCWFLSIGFLLMQRDAPTVSVIENNNTMDFCSTVPTCSSCVHNPQCGFCYQHKGSKFLEGSCSPVYPPSPDSQANYGRCGPTNETISQYKWAVGWCPSNYSLLSLAGLLLYLLCFSPGLGPMPWSINSEIYPLWARGTCTSIATSTNWLSNAFVSITFLTLTEVLTAQGAFFLYGVISLFGLLIFFVLLPETKGLSLEEVEKCFSTSWSPGSLWKSIRSSPIQNSRPEDVCKIDADEKQLAQKCET